MNDLVYGGEIHFLIDGSLAAYSTSAELTVSRGTQDVTSIGEDDNFARKVKLKRIEWSGSFEGLVTRDDNYAGTSKTFDALLNEMVDNDDPVQVTFKPDVSGNTLRYGPALITEMTLTADPQSGEAGTYSGSFEGAGALDSSIVD